MFKLKIKVKNLEEGRKLTKEGYQRILQKSMLKMEELAIENAPFDRGGLRMGISVIPDLLVSKYILTSKMPYSEAMEYGTRPFYAPIDPLKAWAKRKIGDPNVAYAVQAKIAKYGITAQPFMRPAFYQVKDFWVRVYAKEEFDE